jgi:mitochondrial import inner membrane translocase subunit TIM17
MDEYTREPCPWRILDDSGGAFIMGAIGGGIFHSIKGFRNAPIGFNRKMVQILTLLFQKDFAATNLSNYYLNNCFSSLEV